MGIRIVTGCLYPLRSTGLIGAALSRTVLAALILLPLPALGAYPEDVTPSAMVEYDGQLVLDSKRLGRDYEQLIKELGTVVANKPMAPAETLGEAGWDFAYYMQFVFNEARDRGDDPSPWARAHQQADPLPYQWIPTFAARKGLPMSTEVGFNVGWVGMSNTGVVGGFGRFGLVEGYKPWPDVSVSIGYSGYVNNKEIDLGVLDMGVTIGSTWATGHTVGVNSAQISPWANFTTLRISSAPNIDEDVAGEIGATTYKGGNNPDFADAVKPLVVPQADIGFQIVSRNIHTRVSLAWAPSTIPSLNTGMGMTF